MSDSETKDDVLRRIVIAWDVDDDLDFMAAIRLARHMCGLRLASAEEEESEAWIMASNGFGPHGERP